MSIMVSSPQRSLLFRIARYLMTMTVDADGDYNEAGEGLPPVQEDSDGK